MDVFLYTISLVFFDNDVKYKQVPERKSLVDRRPSSNPPSRRSTIVLFDQDWESFFSIEVGLISIKSMTDGFKMYKPALILLPTNSTGFSTNLSIKFECLCRGQ